MKKWFAAAALALCMAATGVSVSASAPKAVFDFGDSAFFAVRMEQGESVYLALDTQYDRAAAQQFFADTGLEADRFFRFDTGEEDFWHTGELLLQADEGEKVYKMEEDGSFTELDVPYVNSLTVGNKSDKFSGYLIKTRELGSYVIA